MASNTKDYSALLKWIPIAGFIVLLGGGFMAWGSADERIDNNKEKIEAIDKRVIKEFDKIRQDQREWRKRDAEDRKRYDATLRGVQAFLNSLRPPTP
ncbi:hypothetical protein LCGC14_1170080 [marine sediment metagenome]|uniref:Uncharacterized protein n=1 Tax=marine sediment metagenome TaxID=412755 RepID=A0A0F9P891_9ZZZZ